MAALPADLIDEIRATVGAGNPLRHVAETVEEKRRQAALREFLTHHERKYGPISDLEVQEELSSLLARTPAGPPGPGACRAG